MKTIRLAVFDTKPYDRRFFEEANTSFHFDITFFETRLTASSAKMAAGFDVVCAFVNDDVNAAAIGELLRCGVRMLVMRCAGYNNVDLRAAKGRLPAARVPGYSPHAVAEYALAMLLTLNRSLHRAWNRVREGNFSINGLIGFDLRGRTVGVIGTGRIGLVFAELLQGFGVRVLGNDPYPNHAEAERIKMKYTDRVTLFRESDVISLHCPLTSENRHLINARAIGQMKPGVYIINTSRGKLIDTAALISGLKKGRIGGAALDVYEEETGYFFEDRSDAAIADDVLARLLTFPNVLVTSHQAFFTVEAMRNIANTTLENIRSFFREARLVNAIEPPV